MHVCESVHVYARENSYPRCLTNGTILILIIIVNFPYMCSNTPTKPTYGVYISQLIRISRICDKFDSFIKRHRLLTDRLIKQGFWYSKLCSSFRSLQGGIVQRYVNIGLV